MLLLLVEWDQNKILGEKRDKFKEMTNTMQSECLPATVLSILIKAHFIEDNMEGVWFSADTFTNQDHSTDAFYCITIEIWAWAGGALCHEALSNSETKKPEFLKLPS